ncbi:MAG: phosphoribosylformylglycinamidine cyclo-ligase, partial [Gammaproteobacteria bacterium]
DGARVTVGNRLIALASSGPHSNGYSLVRKIIAVSAVDLSQDCDGRTLAESLIQPTRIYVKNILKLAESHTIRAIAHITGGGLNDNIPRVLPPHCAARIELASWTLPRVFEWLQTAGNVETSEMFRTFNCGVGMVLVVDQDDQDDCLRLLDQLGEQAWVIGEIVEKESGPSVILA